MSKKNGSFDEVYGGIGLEPMYVRISLTLIRNLGGLGLTGTEFAILAYLLSFKWGTAMPFPSIESLGKALGFEPGSRGRGREEEPDYSGLRKALKRLEQKGFIRIIQRKLDRDRNTTNVYDLKPLFQKLKALEVGGQEPGAAPPPASRSDAARSVNSNIRAKFGGARLGCEEAKERVVEPQLFVGVQPHTASPAAPVPDPTSLPLPSIPRELEPAPVNDSLERIDSRVADDLLKAANIDSCSPDLTIEEFSKLFGPPRSSGWMPLKSDVEAVIARVQAKRAEEWERDRPQRETARALMDARIREQQLEVAGVDSNIRARFGGAKLSNDDDSINAPDEHAPDPWSVELDVEVPEEHQDTEPQPRLASWHKPIVLTGHVAQMAERLREAEREARDRYGYDDEPAPDLEDHADNFGFVESEPPVGVDAVDDAADW